MQFLIAFFVCSTYFSFFPFEHDYLPLKQLVSSKTSLPVPMVNTTEIWSFMDSATREYPQSTVSKCTFHLTLQLLITKQWDSPFCLLTQMTWITLSNANPYGKKLCVSTVMFYAFRRHIFVIAHHPNVLIQTSLMSSLPIRTEKREVYRRPLKTHLTSPYTRK